MQRSKKKRKKKKKKKKKKKNLHYEFGTFVHFLIKTVIIMAERTKFGFENILKYSSLVEFISNIFICGVFSRMGKM